MSYRFVLAKCSACGLTKKLKPEEAPGPGKCLGCTRCLGIFDIVEMGGRCCACGYMGGEETACAQRDDKTHCEHWYDGPGNGEAT